MKSKKTMTLKMRTLAAPHSVSCSHVCITSHLEEISEEFTDKN
jgi:hypothetical protein